jgi:MFS transporter, DHA1 family, multidrug resistance protein
MAFFLPAFPIILRRMGLTDSAEIFIWSGVLFGAAPLSAALIGPFWGALGDRIGRKAMVLRALLGVTVFVGAMSFVEHPMPLLVLRLAQGVFSGFIAPSLTLVSVHAPLERQGRIAATLQFAILAGAVIGPPLGGWILDRTSPSFLFSTTAAAALFSALLVATQARELVPPVPASPGAKRMATVLSAFRDVRDVVADPVVLKLLLAIFAARFGSTCVEPVFAAYAQEFASESSFVASHPSFANGVLVSATNLGNLLALPFWGRRGDRHGHRRTLAIAAAGAGLLYPLQAFAPEPISLFAIRFCAGIFLAGTVPAAYGMVAEETPAERRGSSYSLTFSALALASSIAPLVGGNAAAAIGVKHLFLVSAIPMLGAAAWIASWNTPRGGKTAS